MGIFFCIFLDFNYICTDYALRNYVKSNKLLIENTMKKTQSLMRIFTLLLLMIGVVSSVFGAYYMKHQWGGNSWEWKQLDNNNEVIANYGGSGVNINTSASDTGADWIAEPTLACNSISNGTSCVFKYSNGTVTITPVDGCGGSGAATIYIPGDFNSWSETGNPVDDSGVAVIKLAKTTYRFKIKIGSTWYGNGGTMVRDNCTDWGFKSTDGDAHITADVAGDYTFKVVVRNGEPRLTVTYPSNAVIKLSASKTFRDYDDTQAITLTATAENATFTSYKWQVSVDGETWTNLATTSVASYKLEGENLPTTTSSYRVIGSGTATVTSGKKTISVLEGCGDGTEMVPVFTMDFGTLTSETARSSDLGGGEVSYGEDGYKAYPNMINDGNYAVVATPYNCGCGNDPAAYNYQVSNACLNERAWYRQKLSDGKLLRDRDYINGKDNGTKYGGMLMINFDNTSTKPVFTRVLTDVEKAQFANKARLSFSAWFACAAQPHDDVAQDKLTDINMVLKIQYSEDAGQTWKDGKDADGNVSALESTVSVEEDWVCLSTDLEIVDRDYDYRIVITNNSSSGVGNDVLIDDIQLHLCKPTFKVYFEDAESNKVEQITLTNIEEKTTVVLPNQNFGSIANPCVMLFKQKGTKYRYLGNMEYDRTKDIYTSKLENDALVDEVPETINIIAVVSPKTANNECDVNVQMGVENGRILPNQNPIYVFSTNTLTANVDCFERTLTLAQGGDINPCISTSPNEPTPMPLLNLTSENNLTSQVYYDVLINDEDYITNQSFNVQQKTNQIDLNEQYARANNASYYPFEAGKKYVFTVKVYEMRVDGTQICSDMAEGSVTVNIKPQAQIPITTKPNDKYAYNMCSTEGTWPYDQLIDVEKFNDDYKLYWLSAVDSLPLTTTGFDRNVPTRDAEGNSSCDSLLVYNKPDGSCESDTIKVYYRVKESTPAPIVDNYNECVVDNTNDMIMLRDLVHDADSYKYLIFSDSEGNEVRGFEPWTPTEGVVTYNVLASMDEIESTVTDNCEAETTITVKVKDHAVADNINVNDKEVCPRTEVNLIAKDSLFTAKQENILIRWYDDSSLDKANLVKEGNTYSILDVTEAQTFYVTIQTDDYCENQAGDAAEVSVELKQASPQLSIEPKEQLITIGAKPSFTVTPAQIGQAAEYSVLVNGAKIEGLAQYKPYVDSEYIIRFDGECGVTSDTATVQVQWPTAITPYDENGLNDTFVKDMDPNFHTAIFNRFGMPLMETDNGWDGFLHDGKLAVPGVYYYVVTLPDGNVKKGTIEVFKQ